MRSIFLVRDPRDVALSDAHYIARSPRHPRHAAFAAEATVRDRVVLRIRGRPEQGVAPLARMLACQAGWLRSGALVLRFEDLVGAEVARVGRYAAQRALAPFFTRSEAGEAIENFRTAVDYVVNQDMAPQEALDWIQRRAKFK